MKEEVYLKYVLEQESKTFRRRLHRWTVDASASLNQDLTYFWSDEFESDEFED